MCAQTELLTLVEIIIAAAKSKSPFGIQKIFVQLPKNGD